MLLLLSCQMADCAVMPVTKWETTGPAELDALLLLSPAREVAFMVGKSRPLNQAGEAVCVHNK